MSNKTKSTDITFYDVARSKNYRAVDRSFLYEHLTIGPIVFAALRMAYVVRICSYAIRG